MNVYFNKNNSVKIQQDFFFLSFLKYDLIGCFVRILSKPSHAHKFHANAKYINLRGQWQNQCAHCGGCQSQL